ncbi:MAG TPA: hypothetical protein VG935_00915, partial [Patescibacteria group bacterium]|nr:hypothetical protein [Patescibacteria group bacterium]
NTAMGQPTNHYKGAIWTNHALERLGQRGLSQDLAWQAFSHPDRELPGKNSGTMEYQRRFGPSLVTIIAKQNERREWIILSNWIDPPLPGTMDYYKKEEYKRYQKSGFWGKIFLSFKKQLFG